MIAHTQMACAEAPPRRSGTSLQGLKDVVSTASLSPGYHTILTGASHSTSSLAPTRHQFDAGDPNSIPARPHSYRCGNGTGLLPPRWGPKRVQSLQARADYMRPFSHSRRVSHAIAWHDWGRHGGEQEMRASCEPAGRPWADLSPHGSVLRVANILLMRPSEPRGTGRQRPEL